MSNISDRIRYYRKRRGLTQVDVATGLGVRVDNYAKYESGARVPRADRLIKLAKILGTSYDALNEGIVRPFADLLKSHAVGSITGEAGSVTAFVSDMETSGEAYWVVSEFFNRGEHRFVAESPEFFRKYMATPNVASLIALYDLYQDQLLPEKHRMISAPCLPTIPIVGKGPLPEGVKEPSILHLLEPLNVVTALKWAFCIAVTRYLERTDAIVTIEESEKLLGDFLEHIGPLQFFATKIFVPYLSFIIDAVHLCMNTNIDDFEKAFLFYALTPPEDDDESHDDNSEDY